MAFVKIEKSSAFSSLAIVIISSQQASTKSNGAPLANTGSPGDGANNTCAKSGCHLGTVNSFPGSVTIDVSDIPVAGYAPGETYTIGVTVAESGRNTFGFQLTAENANKTKMGTYSSSSGVRLEFDDWVTHSMNSGTGVWAVSWTAPTGNDNITFYATGNAANGNGNSNGDHIYSGSTTVSRDLLASVNDIIDNPDFKVYNIYNEKSLIIESERAAAFNVYSISGRHVESFRVDRGTTTINLSSLNDGQYIVSEVEGKFASRIIVK